MKIVTAPSTTDDDTTKVCQNSSTPISKHQSLEEHTEFYHA